MAETSSPSSTASSSSGAAPPVIGIVSTASDVTSFRYAPTSSSLAQHLRSTRATFIEIGSHESLYLVICKYLAEKSPREIRSYQIQVNNNQYINARFQPHLTEEEEEEKRKRDTLKLTAGLGTHEIAWMWGGDRRKRVNEDKDGENKNKDEDGGGVAGPEKVTIKIVHQEIGEPVKSRQRPVIMASLVVFVELPHREELVKQFCQEALDLSYQAADGHYNILSWFPDHVNWSMMAVKRIRPIESVILPEKVKEIAVKDVVDFCSRETARWYFDHGVPYKRCLLFYGPPGTGKSSLITALAGLLKRSVCFLQPAHPSVTDDNLQQAIQRAPPRSLIVFEDIDALFDKNRKSEISGVSPLTFSGLLNALDGVCNPEAQIFIMTTNHIDRLDPALIRSGRVDLKVPFPAATAKQAETLFLHFYPNEEESAKKFAAVMFERFPSKFQGDRELAGKSTSEVIDNALLGGWNDSHRLSVSMASMQGHFIACRKKSAKEAVELASVKEFFDPDNAEEELERKMREEEEARKKAEEEAAKEGQRGRSKSRGRGRGGRFYRGGGFSRSPSPVHRYLFKQLL